MTSSRKALVLILFFWLPAVILFLSSESGEIRDLRLREDAREDAVRDMVGRIRSESGESPEMFVDPDVLPVAGEEELYDVSSGNSATDGLAQDEHAKSGSSLDVGSSSEGGGSSDGHNTTDGSSRRLRAYGTIVIPSIDCELPLWDGAGKFELRYGAGRMPGSSEAGAPGNLVIFGHRMRRYGSIFNRLGDVSIGDSIVIEHSGQAFTYTVDAIDTVEPSSLSAYIGMENEGDPGSCRITLITCTPIGVGSHRLVITGHLASGG